MEEQQSTWLNDGPALALVLSLLVFAVPALAVIGALFSAYYGPGAVDWRVLVSIVAIFVTAAMWFAEARWARRGGVRAAAVGAVPLVLFSVIGVALWLAPGLFGLDARSIGVAPSLIGVVGFGGLALHALLAWIAIATAPAAGDDAVRATKAASPGGSSSGGVKTTPKRPRKKAR